MEDGVEPVRFEMRTSRSWVQAVDNWRRKQSVIPSRSAAIRSLVNVGLFAIDLANEGFSSTDDTAHAKVADALIEELVIGPMKQRGPGAYLYDSSEAIDPDPNNP